MDSLPRTYILTLHYKNLVCKVTESCFAQVTGLVAPGEYHQTLEYGDYLQAGSTCVKEGKTTIQCSNNVNHQAARISKACFKKMAEQAGGSQSLEVVSSFTLKNAID